MGAIAARALEPFGYTVTIEAEASMGCCPGLVQTGAIHFRANQGMTTRWAYAGIHSYAETGGMPRLQTLATIMTPAARHRRALGDRHHRPRADRKAAVPTARHELDIGVSYEI
jgi:hypothetical protein